MRILFHASLVICPRVVAPGASAFVSSSIVAKDNADRLEMTRKWRQRDPRHKNRTKQNEQRKDGISQLGVKRVQNLNGPNGCPNG